MEKDFDDMTLDELYVARKEIRKIVHDLNADIDHFESNDEDCDDEIANLEAFEKDLSTIDARIEEHLKKGGKPMIDMMDGAPDPQAAKKHIARVLMQAKDPAIIGATVSDEGEFIVTFANGDSYDFAANDFWPAEK